MGGSAAQRGTADRASLLHRNHTAAAAGEEVLVPVRGRRSAPLGKIRTRGESTPARARASLAALPELLLVGEELNRPEPRADPVVERRAKTRTVRSTTSSRAQRRHEGAGAADRPRQCRWPAARPRLDRPSPYRARGGDRAEGGHRERAVDLVGLPVQKKPDQDPARPARGAVLEEDLEALHRIARPGVVARDDQVGRRGVEEGLEPAPPPRRQAGPGPRVGVPGRHVEHLPGAPQQVADREARTEQSGPPERIACRIGFWAAGAPEEPAGLARHSAPGGARPPGSSRWLVPGKISLYPPPNPACGMRQDRPDQDPEIGLRPPAGRPGPAPPRASPPGLRRPSRSSTGGLWQA